MYLKSIEIRGFKSFADRTLLNFKDGITAVVGPNGSGKSNISDAVRWVLGEQKVKSLRGGKMEDVIFSGTDFRKALGFAEVTLLLDNSERSLSVPFSEVSVTRKLFRSGESEYLINNTGCRLKDIHELFMDTGIGKEGYSLIGQGKIEAILSGKMEDRRALLEEAAGIVKYKARKEEAEKKLDNTEQNLLRVNDILETYEERIGPLEKEKEKAEKFIVLSQEQRGISISLILSDLEEFEEEKTVQDLRFQETSRRYEEAKTAREKAQADKEALELAMEEKKAEETLLKETFYAEREETETLTGELKLLSQGIEDRKKNLERNARSLELNQLRQEETKDELAILKEQLEESQKALEEVAEGLTTRRSRQKALQESLKLSEEAQRGLRDEEEDTDLQVEKLQKTQLETARLRDTLKGKMENGDSMIQGFQASLGWNEQAVEDIAVQIRQAEDTKKAEEEAQEKRRMASSEVRTKLSEKDAKLKNLDYEIRGQESQLSVLKNLEAHYEGYSRSVKSLMNELKASGSRMAEKVALVGEVIKPKAGYEVALEVALGSQVNHVITPTDKDAKELIELLRRKSFGRATFFPLNIIKGFKAKDPQLKRGTLLGNLYDLVEFDARYEGIAANLLGRIFVARNLEEALVAAKEMGYTMRIVTLEGDIINAGGSMTGGSQNAKSSGIFSRKKDLEDLTESLVGLKEQRGEEIRSRQRILEALEERSREEKEASYVLQELTMAIATLKERQEGFRKDILRQKDVIAGARRDRAQQAVELETLEETLKSLEDKVREKLQMKEKNRDYLKGLKDKRTREYQENDELTEFIMAESIKEARLNEAHRAMEENLGKFQVTLVQLETALEELQREQESLVTEIREAEEQVKSHGEKLQLLKEEVARKEKILEAMAMTEVKDKVKLKELSNIARTLEEEFYTLDKELFKVGQALEKLEKERTVLLSKINEEMNLTLAEAKEERIPMEDKDQFRKRLNELRRLITALGNVNVAAIEEFRQVSEHREFLTTQKNDLEKAKLELKELILDMTLRMRAMFTENFKVLNENFNDTFRRLFQGGQANLLLGEGDILEAPIEISVQPPGKKLQNINLMSGGEKVLSAIALTFAILRMKPTPFCILDEIEAALDDANVYRFAEFLTEFARDTQFILITHRKGTMEAADALYGVTMEEKGISKIISMDLSEARRTNG